MAGTASNKTVCIGYQVGLMKGKVLKNYTTLFDRRRKAWILALKKGKESEFMKRTSYTDLKKHNRYVCIMLDFGVVVFYPVAGRYTVDTTVVHTTLVCLSQKVHNDVHAT